MILKRLVTALVCLCALVLMLIGCRDDAAPTGGIMIVVETDLGVPKDLDRVDLIVTRRGATLRSDQITLSPAKLLPTNIELRADREGGAPVTIQAVGRKDGRARIVREAVTTIPAARLATLHMPLNYLCDATAVEAKPGEVTSTCAAGLTCVQGVCAPSAVSEESLPTFAPSTPAPANAATDTSCFDVTKCFATANELPLDLSDCSIETPQGATAAKLTLALKEPLTAAGICDGAACWVVLDQEGWIPVGAGATLGARIQLPPGVCIARTQGKPFALAASTTCTAKTAQRELCPVWSPPKTIEGDVGHACTGPSDESCDNCGRRSRTCSNGDWSPWGPCIGAGPCTPKATGTCGGGSGARTCGDTCQWNACSSACTGTTPDTRACGNCGTQTRACAGGTWSDWSVCTQGECAPTTTRSCATGPGVQTCTDACRWGDCAAAFCPGPASQPCGTRCGSQTRSCVDGTWSDWSTTCIGEGACVPLTTQPCVGGGVQTCGPDCAWAACPPAECPGSPTQPCGHCGTQSRTCDAGTGVWSDWGPCTNEGVCAPGASQDCGGGSTRTCNAATCQWSACTVAPVCIQGVAGGNPNEITPYDCTTSSNYWDQGPSEAFSLDTATPGEDIRFSTDGSDVDCTSPCANNASCTQCTSPSPDNGTCTTPALAPFAVIKAIGCKAASVASTQRVLTYADATPVVTLDPPSPASGTYPSQVRVSLTSIPTQPALPAFPGTNDVHICFTSGVATTPDPTCSVLTGLCGIGSSEYDASALPVVPAPGGTLKAIACKSGVPSPSAVQTVTYDINGPPGAPTGIAAPPVGYAVTTLAGSGVPAYADGTGTGASFNLPIGLTLDAAANVYVADRQNHRIRIVTPGGVVTTLAGSGTATFADGTGSGASFAFPEGVGADAAGNVYVADYGNQRIRIVTPGGVVTTLAGSGTATFADGTGTGASFNFPAGVAVDAAGNAYVDDQSNNRIRIVTPAGVVTTLAGSGASAFADGTGTTASFAFPAGVALDPAGSVYVADFSNNRIRVVTPAGVVTTLAGSGASAFADGTGTTASFSQPAGVAVDANGKVYVADFNNNRIRMVTPAGVVTTLAGSGAFGFADGTGAAAVFNNPGAIAVDLAGNLYVCDKSNHRIRKLTPNHGQLAIIWNAPTDTGTSPITGYTATATAAGQTTQTCTTAGPTACTISGLTTGVAYSVSVTATNASGPGSPSPAATGTPN
jgi:sugar lactone lactonase YvrE